MFDEGFSIRVGHVASNLGKRFDLERLLPSSDYVALTWNARSLSGPNLHGERGCCEGALQAHRQSREPHRRTRTDEQEALQAEALRLNQVEWLY